MWVYSVDISFKEFLKLISIIEGQFGFEFQMRCLHVFMFGVGYCLSWLIYTERLGNILKALLW